MPPQADFVVDNGPGLAVRTDINAQLLALATLSSGPVEPATKYAGMLWLDTSVSPNGLLRQRNLANTAWLTLQSGAKAPTETVISATGVQTWTKPANCTHIRVRGSGAGAAGGGTTGGGAGTAVGTGGGASGFAGQTGWLDVSAVSSIAFTVGAKGIGAVSVTGAAGGASSFTLGATTYTFGGGNGGMTGTGTSTTLQALLGGAPAVGTNVRGSSSPGEAGVGMANMATGGAGGSNATGSGAVGTRGNGSSSAGSSAAGLGGGGGGAVTCNTTSSHAGGDGANGGFIIEEAYGWI